MFSRYANFDESKRTNMTMSKRTHEALDAAEHVASPKRTCFSLFGGAGTTTSSLPSRATRRSRRVIVEDDEDDDDDNDEATPGNTSSPSAGHGTAEVPATTEGDAVVETSESAAKVEADSSSSEPASSSRKTASGSKGTTDTTTPVSEPESTRAEANKKATKTTTRTSQRKPRRVNGLLNNGNRCFSNATLQLFDAALDGHNLDAVLGKDTSIKPFAEPILTLNDHIDAPEPETKTNSRSKSRAKKPAKTPAKAKSKGPKSRLSKLKASIQDRITKSRAGDKPNDISPRRHLRALLHRMRKFESSRQAKWLSPLMFQQILAHGDEEASPPRDHLDGTTQEDSYEYFQAVINAAANEESEAETDEAESTTGLDSLFDIKSETATVCSNPSCDHKGSVKAETSNAVSIPVLKSRKKVQLMDLLDAANTSTLDGECPKCSEETLARVTELTEVSDNLVVHVNRVGADLSSKILTSVELPMQPITLGGKQFVLNAVIRHRGSSADGGHYSIFRRRSPEWTTESKSLWYLIDDEEVSAVKAINMRDGRWGHSAMLLFKAL